MPDDDTFRCPDCHAMLWRAHGALFCPRCAAAQDEAPGADWDADSDHTAGLEHTGESDR